MENALLSSRLDFYKKISTKKLSDFMGEEIKHPEIPREPWIENPCPDCQGCGCPTCGGSGYVYTPNPNQ